jgi:hypothetical protein
MNVWSAHAKTNGTWIATRLIGLFGSPSEISSEVVIADAACTPFESEFMGSSLHMNAVP